MTKTKRLAMIEIIVLLVCVLAFGVGMVAINANSAYAMAVEPTLGDGEVEFTTTVTGETTRYVDSLVQGPYGQVTVTYKITDNDGFNSILLVPEYDTNVFSIASNDDIVINSDVTDESVFANATITNGNGTKKILLEKTGDKYAQVDENEDVFLTITYTIIAPTAGNYDFGLITAPYVENGSSIAFEIVTDGEHLGEQERVAITVVKENTLTLVQRANATIEIGYNTTAFNTGYTYEVPSQLYYLTDDIVVDAYVYTYARTSMSDQKVNTLPAANDAVPFEVSYTYSGDGDVHVNWYTAVQSGADLVVNEQLPNNEAPIYPGEYLVGISADASDAYYAVEEQYRFIRINRIVIEITPSAQSGAYGEAIKGTDMNTPGTGYSVTGSVLTGDNYGAITIVTDATQSSVPGEYTISVSIDTTEAVNAGFYDVRTSTATYNISKKSITLTALDQTTTYTGSAFVPDQTMYTLTSGGSPFVIDGATVAITTGNNVCTNAGFYQNVLLPTINVSSDLYYITTESGDLTINTAGVQAQEISGYFTGLEVTYDANPHDLLEVSNNLPGYYNYNVTSNNRMQTNAGSYIISITVTSDGNHHFIGSDSSLQTSVTGKINPAAVTISADPKWSYYGATPEALTYSVTSGTVYNNEITSSSVTLSTSPTITTTTPKGNYVISVSVGSFNNYDVTTVTGTYEVKTATPVISLSAGSVYYNRDLEISKSATINTLNVAANLITVKYYSDAQCTNEVVPSDVKTYYVKAYIAADTVNENYYAAATDAVPFEIKAVQLQEVTFTPSHGTVTWTNVAADTGKTDALDDGGVTAKALKNGTTLTYEVYDSNNNLEKTIIPGQTLTFDAKGSESYYIKAIASDANYGYSITQIGRAYEVSFDEGTHDGVASGIPATSQFVFAGQTAVEPDDPDVTIGYFSYWALSGVQYHFTEAVDGDIELVAVWGVAKRTITLKYLPNSNTQGTDLFILSIADGQSISYAGLGVNPTKASANAGIYYTFAGKWVLENNTEIEYNAVNDAISGYTVNSSDGNVNFIAVFDTNYNSFEITYYFSDNEATTGYEQFGEKQTVTYGTTIEYRTYTGANVRWFKKDYWYANETRTEEAPTTMPAANISVYGTYKFDIGTGDVNASGTVTADDITLYRKWIVGGYDMIEVEPGTEWALVHDLEFDVNGVYFLKRVADNDTDDSKDIRDVSITRMALVGGYAWDIVSGESVTGAEVVRSNKVNTYPDLATWFEAGNERVSVTANITDTTAEFEIATNKNIFIDLCDHTLTVKSINFTTSGTGATITVKNGTIVTTDGITITAPNGNVTISNVTAYDNGNLINLQAASSSLHFFGAVSFRKGTVAESSAADVKVATGTHIVIEQAAQVEAKKIIAAIIENDEFVEDTTAEITITNESEATEAIEIVGSYVEANSTVENKIITKVYTKAELLAVESGKTVYLGDDIVYAGQLVIANKTLVLDLNGFTIQSTGDVAISVIGQDANLTIKGEGNVIAQEACVLALDGATFTIDGGTYTAIDNFVFGTNGSPDRGGNTITVNAGMFNGQITTAGFVACGIYVANSDTVVVNGGTFNITNGVGILARSGSTTVGEDVVFDVTGDGHLGKVGDSKVTVPSGKELVVDLVANYPGGAPVIANESNYDVYAVIAGNEVVELTFVSTLNEMIAACNVAPYIALAGDLAYTGSLVFTTDTVLFLNGHTIDAHTSGNPALCVDTAEGKLAIYGSGNVLAREGCVLVVNGAELIVNGGTYTCYDNFVFGTNGSAGKGNNTITINAGTFNGQITSAGYVACGIYVANSDTVVVNGGTFNITDGVGILARSGSTTVGKKVVFNVTGDGHLGKVGDSKVTVPSGAELVWDLKANYPGGTPTVTNNSDYELVTVE